MLLPKVVDSILFQTRDDDDVIDRLHYFITTNLLIALSILVSFKQFGGKPIECMTPDSFPNAWEQYAENFCWAQDTYFIPFDQYEIPKDSVLRHRQRISYYQWVPFALLVKAILFWLPSIIWRLSSGHSGMRVDHLVRMATAENNIKPEVRQNTIRILTVHLENALRFHKRAEKRNVTPHKYFRCLNLTYTAAYVSLIYLVTKTIYLLNVAAQFSGLNAYLVGSGAQHRDQAGPYEYYGIGALADLINGTTWHTSGVFPRVTLCDFQVRAVGSNVQNFTIQCVLVINLFNEKIFIFLWFWYAILGVLTLFSCIYWTIILTIPCFSRHYIARHLELSEIPISTDDESYNRNIYRFVHRYLKTDGIFILRMVTMHTSIIFGTDLVQSLWQSFYGIEDKIPLEQRVEESRGGKSFSSVAGLIGKLSRLKNSVSRDRTYEVSQETSSPGRRRPQSFQEANPIKLETLTANKAKMDFIQLADGLKRRNPNSCSPETRSDAMQLKENPKTVATVSDECDFMLKRRWNNTFKTFDTDHDDRVDSGGVRRDSAGLGPLNTEMWQKTNNKRHVIDTSINNRRGSLLDSHVDTTQSRLLSGGSAILGGRNKRRTFM